MTMSNKVLTASAKLVAAAIEAKTAPKPPRRAASSRTDVPVASEPVAAPQTGRTKKAPAKVEQATVPLVKATKALAVIEPAPTKPAKAKKTIVVEQVAPAAPAQRGMGIGALARKLMLEHQDWTHKALAAEVNARIPGAQATEKSLRWYACDLRKRGISGAERVRSSKEK